MQCRISSGQAYDFSAYSWHKRFQWVHHGCVTVCQCVQFAMLQCNIAGQELLPGAPLSQHTMGQPASASAPLACLTTARLWVGMACRTMRLVLEHMGLPSILFPKHVAAALRTSRLSQSHRAVLPRHFLQHALSRHCCGSVRGLTARMCA